MELTTKNCFIVFSNTTLVSVFSTISKDYASNSEKFKYLAFQQQGVNITMGV